MITADADNLPIPVPDPGAVTPQDESAWIESFSASCAHVTLRIGQVTSCQQLFVMRCGVSAPWFAKKSAKPFAFLLTDWKTVPLKSANNSAILSVALASLQCLVTLLVFVPAWRRFAAEIAKEESPSTMIFPCLKDLRIFRPCSSAANSASLFVNSPNDLQ